MERPAPCSGYSRDEKKEGGWPPSHRACGQLLAGLAAFRPSSPSKVAASSPPLTERSVSITLVGTWVEMQIQTPPTPTDKASAGYIWGSSVFRSQRLPAC